MAEMVDEERARRVSELLDGVDLAVAAAAATIVGIMENDEGEITEESRVSFAVMNDAGREDLIKRLVRECVPPDASLDQWRDWLEAGGSDPSKAPVSAAHRTSSRSRRLSRIAGGLDKAKADFETAKAGFEEARSALVHARQVEAAAIANSLQVSLRREASKAMAMGPAWLLMRAVSAHVSQAEAEYFRMTPKQVEALRRSREAEAGETMATMDYLATEPAFERDLRDAIAGVAKRWADEHGSVGPGGIKPMKRHYMSAVRKAATRDAEEVLEAVPRAVPPPPVAVGPGAGLTVIGGFAEEPSDPSDEGPESSPAPTPKSSPDVFLPNGDEPF